MKSFFYIFFRLVLVLISIPIAGISLVSFLQTETPDLTTLFWFCALVISVLIMAYSTLTGLRRLIRSFVLFMAKQ